MREIILEKRYPHSREEDITDAFMRGYEIGKEQEHRWWSAFCANCKTESDSEKPNNCEHITEDGVTCAKYPACDDCLDNPLNKVKGSERLVKGSEQTEPTISKMEQVDKDINVRSKDEPQTADCPFDDDAIPCEWVCTEYGKCKYKPKDEPQPQTCSFSDCDNFKNPDYERCIECKRKQIKLKTEQTERSE